MYLVRDKITKKVIHVNPAPLSQDLRDKDIYFDFDPKTMEIGKTDKALPEHYTITEKEEIVELSLKERIDKGLISLQPHEKVENNRIARKSEEELVKEGLIKLLPSQKIVAGRIVSKSLTEQVADGLITLTPLQKIVGTKESEHIVQKTLAEQAAEGLIKLSPGQKVENEQVVQKTTQELLDEGLLTLDAVKEKTIQKLREETEAYFARNKTKNGYRLDGLARQKANFSHQFRSVAASNADKKKLLQDRLIYPDDILDEIMEEVKRVQEAYAAAKAQIDKDYKKKSPAAAFETISLSDYLSKPASLPAKKTATPTAKKRPVKHPAKAKSK